MPKPITTTQVRQNIFYSLGAQGASLLLGLVLGLCVPKAISQLQYAYWQTYVLYAGYVGVLHFGLLDGLVLRYSQYDYEELDFARVKSQFQILLFITSCFSLITVLLANFFFHGIGQIIAYLVAISMVTKNIFTYTSYSFQITNRIKNYAFFAMLYRGIYLVIILGLLCFKNDYYLGFCLADIFADILAVLIMLHTNRKLYFGKALTFVNTWIETWLNTKSGILLMASNWAAMLIVGSSKMIIQWHWDPIIFGKVSFSFNVASLFLAFIGSISIVLFPTIKRLNIEMLPVLYVKIRQGMSILLFILLLGYFPGGYILQLWLPKYTQSIVYLGLFLPFVVFSSRVSLITNNYLKAFRQEKTMFFINFICILIAFSLYLLGAYTLHSLTVLLMSIVLIIMISSILSEIIVGKLIKRRFTGEFIQEALMATVFIICARCFSLFAGCGIYAFCVGIYLYLHQKDLKPFANLLLKFIPKRFCK